MWCKFGMNPMVPRFEEVRKAAANVPRSGECGSYTIDMFKADFPQFFDCHGEMFLPETMMNTFIQQANDSVLPSRWGTMWRYAVGLYVAHFAALYLKTYAESSESAAQAASGAAQVGVVKSASMGDTSISYDNSAITSGTDKWGAWNATQYGTQLVTMARMVGMGGMWIG